VLDAASAAKWHELHSGRAEPESFELTINGADGPVTCSFHLAVAESGGDGRTWLIELPKDERIERLHDELTTLNTELVNTQRDLAKGRVRLNRTVAQLEEAIAAKERLHAIMSHELRTPLTAIAGYNQLLLDGAFGELRAEQRVVLQRMRSASQHLQSLIDDVLDFAKIESGELLLEPHVVQVRELLDDVLGTIQPLAQDHGSAVHTDIDAAPETVISDSRRLRQILLNLLSNAAKYGGGGAITLRARQRGRDELMIEVADSGAGIPQDRLDDIFREFVQLDQQQGGTGLGLPIARRLTQLLGGELQVKSEVGRGSTFRVVLPVRMHGETPAAH
jgi:signal transduction histidine kinase